jgi:peptide/nickel transport system substrate-binding protein
MLMKCGVHALLTLVAGLATGVAQAQTVRIAMHSDLKILDPVASTAYISRNHGYLIWDSLFAIDAKFEVKQSRLDVHTARRPGVA